MTNSRCGLLVTQRWAIRPGWRSSTSWSCPIGRRSSCDGSSGSSRTCSPTISTCSSASASSTGHARAATGAAATSTCSATRSTAWRPAGTIAAGPRAVRLHAPTRRAASSPPRCGGRSTGAPADVRRDPSRRPGAPRSGRRRQPRRSRPRRRHARGPRPTSARCRRLVVTVCDQAHEELDADDSWLHWSIPDPVADRQPSGLRRHARRAPRAHPRPSSPIRRRHRERPAPSHRRRARRPGRDRHRPAPPRPHPPPRRRGARHRAADHRRRRLRDHGQPPVARPTSACSCSRTPPPPPAR